jgi:hypothetical protein
MVSKPGGKSKPQELILDTSDLVLTVVRDAARIAPLPYLQDAATLALVIVNVVQVRSLFFSQSDYVYPMTFDLHRESRIIRMLFGASPTMHAAWFMPFCAGILLQTG